MGKYVVQRMKWANLFEIPFSSHMPIFVKNKEKKGHTLMQSTQFSLETYECISAHKRPNKGEILLSIIAKRYCKNKPQNCYYSGN